MRSPRQWLALHARAFAGTYSIEIFRPTCWEREPRVVAGAARAGAAIIARNAGYDVG